jgi:hypothetical protein
LLFRHSFSFIWILDLQVYLNDFTEAILDSLILFHFKKESF